jgi:diguanylate cyclase (GGDEF)-like protein
MELLLWRWSMAVQVTSTLMIAVFFAVLMRSVRRPELRWWTAAWVADLGALAVSLFFWWFQPSGPVVPLLRGLYVAFKTGFVLLLIRGAWSLFRPGAVLLRTRHVLLALGAYSVAAAFLLDSIPRLGLWQHLLMGTLFACAAGPLAVRAGSDLRWLAVGFLLRSALAFVEAGAYALELTTWERIPATVRDAAGLVLAAHSSFDSGLEWLLALGCILAVSGRIQRELRESNRELLAAQEDLRRIADHDPLTGLANRRSLPEIFQSVRDTGATLTFFDLDGFKAINDLHGHAAGDECLKRFATALRGAFLPGDALVRYAGDEFVVVARGPDLETSARCVQGVREHLRKAPGESFTIRFSSGTAVLLPGGDADAALQAADAAMYAAKAPDRGRMVVSALRQTVRGADTPAA